MERVFLFAAMWAFGGALSSDAKCDDRRAFSQEWRKLLPSKTLKLPDQVCSWAAPTAAAAVAAAATNKMFFPVEDEKIRATRLPSTAHPQSNTPCKLEGKARASVCAGREPDLWMRKPRKRVGGKASDTALRCPPPCRAQCVCDVAALFPILRLAPLPIRLIFVFFTVVRLGTGARVRLLHQPRKRRRGSLVRQGK